MKPVFDKDEMEAVLRIAREQISLRLAMAGYSIDNDGIPNQAIERVLEDTFNCLDYEYIMPKHFAKLNVVRDELERIRERMDDPDISPIENMNARSELLKEFKAEPWKKNVLFDMHSALIDIQKDLKTEFKKKVKVGK